MFFRFSSLALAAACLLSVPFTSWAKASRGCATQHLFDLANQALGQGPQAVKAQKAHTEIAMAARLSRPQADRPHARTLTTPHFAVHYALYGIHQIKTVAADAVLMSLADSIRSALANLPAISRDSGVYSRLNALAAPHPDFAVKAAQILENAYAYYVDTLGMHNPQGTAQSLMFQAPAASGGRLVIDLADIGQFGPAFARGEYYGLTIEPPRLAVIVENDFLCRTSLLSSGEIAGDSVSSRLNGRLIHNYAREYELGLKLTIYHEFFHVLQFNYVPNHPRGYHAWYELSAVGMEERKVPEGNDYLQYLPCLFQTPEEVGLLATGGDVCNPEAAYSNGIFHMYLTQAIGESFDAPLWETLSGNGDQLDKALPEVLAQHNHPISKALPDFAARLLLAGRTQHPGHFVDDMPDWPTMTTDSIHPDALNSVEQRRLEPLAFLPIKLSQNFKDERVTASFPGDSSGFRIRITEDTLVVAPYSGPSTLLAPLAEPGESWLLSVNLQTDSRGSFLLSTTDVPFRTYPNPLELSVTDALYFTRSAQIKFPATIEIMDEAGRPVYVQEAANLAALTDWNLRNRKNARIGAGIYYLRINQGKWQTLVALP
jgi:hypothetical protein